MRCPGYPAVFLRHSPTGFRCGEFFVFGCPYPINTHWPPHARSTLRSGSAGSELAEHLDGGFPPRRAADGTRPIALETLRVHFPPKPVATHPGRPFLRKVGSEAYAALHLPLVVSVFFRWGRSNKLASSRTLTTPDFAALRPKRVRKCGTLALRTGPTLTSP